MSSYTLLLMPEQRPWARDSSVRPTVHMLCGGEPPRRSHRLGSGLSCQTLDVMNGHLYSVHNKPIH